jgi:ZIP family zinc transporter
MLIVLTGQVFMSHGIIDMNLLPVYLSFGAFLSELVGGLFVVRFRSKFGLIIAFAAGTLIAIPFFDLLPESIKLAIRLGIPVESIMYATILGFLLLFVLERYFSFHRVCEDRSCKNIHHPKEGIIGAAQLSLHSFLDGFAIGAAFNFDVHVGAVVTSAVIFHRFSDGINIVTIMLNAGNSLRSCLYMLFFNALAPVLGAISTLFINIPEQYIAFLLAGFAGGFLYLGASDLLPEAHQKNPPLPSLMCTLSGFLLIFTILRFLTW